MLLALLIAFQQAPAPTPPDTTGAPLTNAGVLRAAGKVDSVFVARKLDSTIVDAADWAAYLMARLGVKPIPETGLRITLDPRTLRVRGLIRDIPLEAQTALSAFVSMFDPATPIEAAITMDRPSPDAVRFHLDTAWIGGISIPEPMLAAGLQVVGQKYPGLMNGGRDLFVATPPNATIRYSPTGVVLLAPPPPSPKPAPSRPPRRRTGNPP